MRWQQEQNVSHDDQSTSPQLHDTHFGKIISVVAFSIFIHLHFHEIVYETFILTTIGRKLNKHVNITMYSMPSGQIVSVRLFQT